MEVSTREFRAFMAKNNVFTPPNLRVQESSGVKAITGCYVLSEERLNNLSDELFLQIRTIHCLPAVYAHLMSLALTERLVKLGEAASPAASSISEKSPVSNVQTAVV